MQIFKYKLFHRWAASESITDEILIKAIKEMEDGLYEANLDSGLYKKRIAMPGKGKRAGYRTLIAFKGEEKAIFLYGFAKNEQENISEKEKQTYRKLAKAILAMETGTIQKIVESEILLEVKFNEKKFT